jgi:hypothetical protein
LLILTCLLFERVTCYESLVQPKYVLNLSPVLLCQLLQFVHLRLI